MKELYILYALDDDGYNFEETGRVEDYQPEDVFLLGYFINKDLAEEASTKYKLTTTTGFKKTILETKKIEEDLNEFEEMVPIIIKSNGSIINQTDKNFEDLYSDYFDYEYGSTPYGEYAVDLNDNPIYFVSIPYESDLKELETKAKLQSLKIHDYVYKDLQKNY